MIRSRDKSVRDSAFNILQHLTDQNDIDAFCQVWEETRHIRLANLLVQHGWVASTPAHLTVLTALKTGRVGRIAPVSLQRTEPLVLACHDVETEIAQRAHECLVSLKNTDAHECLIGLQDQDTIDVFCQQWAATREPFFQQIIVQAHYVARQPSEIRILTALLSGKMEIVTVGKIEGLEFLARACEDSDPTIAKRAIATIRQQVDTPAIQMGLSHIALKKRYPTSLNILLREGKTDCVNILMEAWEDKNLFVAQRAKSLLARLKNPAAHEALYDRFIQRDIPGLREIVVNTGYAPHEPGQRALFYFLTKQWEKYENLDFDQAFLKVEYQKANHTLRQRIAGIARQAGRLDWANTVIGEHQRNQQHIMTDEEWETIYSVLSEKRQWNEMWRLIQTAPAHWSARMLVRLKEAEWMPLQEQAQKEFISLRQLAQACHKEKIEFLEQIRPQSLRLQGRFTDIPGYVIVISADAQMLASGGYENAVCVCSRSLNKE